MLSSFNLDSTGGFMPDPILDEINLTTLSEIYPHTIEDNFFLDTPSLAYLRAHALTDFTGGANTRFHLPAVCPDDSRWRVHARGDNFNITKRQTLAGAQFDPKLYEVSIPEYLEDLEVLNKGPLAVFSLIDTDLANADAHRSPRLWLSPWRVTDEVSGSGVVGNRPKRKSTAGPRRSMTV